MANTYIWAIAYMDTKPSDDGFTNVGDVINYQVTVSNSGSQPAYLPFENLLSNKFNAFFFGAAVSSCTGLTTILFSFP